MFFFLKQKHHYLNFIILNPYPPRLVFMYLTWKCLCVMQSALCRSQPIAVQREGKMLIAQLITLRTRFCNTFEHNISVCPFAWLHWLYVFVHVQPFSRKLKVKRDSLFKVAIQLQLQKILNLIVSCCGLSPRAAPFYKHQTLGLIYAWLIKRAIQDYFTFTSAQQHFIILILPTRTLEALGKNLLGIRNRLLRFFCLDISSIFA